MSIQIVENFELIPAGIRAGMSSFCDSGLASRDANQKATPDKTRWEGKGEQPRAIKNVRNYADILQEPKTLQTPTETIKEIHSVSIFPLKEDTPDDTKTKFQKEIKPAKLKLGIKDVRKLKKGGLVIHGDIKSDVDILKRKFKTNGSLKKDYAFKQMPRLNPKIILHGIEEHLTNEEVIANLKAQNDDLKKSANTLDFIMNTKKGKSVIISSDPKTFEKIIRKEKAALIMAMRVIAKNVKINLGGHDVSWMGEDGFGYRQGRPATRRKHLDYDQIFSQDERSSSGNFHP
ncbi:hypothetical protein AVEN_553-1 [Araneus ventricosus]|uniref:Uncharacterized protein n=1 Tax=Araneus ventricosus TaxID=182803 RepID=A0A4Y2I7U8_ARAVE|nr:hypothetical protein AVEN_553-1 [Araneus ventricosus]